MKKILIMALSAILLLGACDDKLDIVPKGQTTLSYVDDLELLLNQEYDLSVSPASDLGMICNESLGDMLANVPEMLSQPNTLNYANMTYDESVDRATLAQNDARYEAIYKYVNYMNVILDKIDDAEGDASRKPAIKAQAKVMRAYLHYLAVNIYAAQYDEATASSEGGIAYVDDTDASTQKAKLTIQEVYDKMLADCSDETIAQLPAQSSDVFHTSQATGYAIRAKILFQMKRYAEALPYAQKALELNSKIEDRSSIAETSSWTLAQDSPNNLLAIKSTARACPTFETVSAETAAKFEVGDYVKNYDMMGWNALYGSMIVGVQGCEVCMCMSACTTSYGINVERTYYLAAECLIRTGKIREGLAMVDKVRAKRVEDYQSYASLYDENPMTEQEAMALLQKAKWIECLGSYENFFDSKRWNTEDDYKQTITRMLVIGGSSMPDFGGDDDDDDWDEENLNTDEEDGDEDGDDEDPDVPVTPAETKTFTIAPNSPLWILPFPANAVRYNSTLTQNYK